MNAGTVIKVRVVEGGGKDAAAVEVADGSDLQGRYDRLAALVLRMGDWLLSARARLLPAEEWDALFEDYQEHLEQWRDLGGQLRPLSLRNRYEPLTGDALVGEVIELFAA